MSKTVWRNVYVPREGSLRGLKDGEFPTAPEDCKVLRIANIEHLDERLRVYAVERSCGECGQHLLEGGVVGYVISIPEEGP